MDKLLRPERLNIDPDSSNAQQEWNHWYSTFKNFIVSYQVSDADKLRILINHVSPSVYEYFAEAKTFNDAIGILVSTFTKPVNEIFARHKLATRKQLAGETVTRYIESLKLLSKDCNFKAVTAEVNRDDCIRDAFIAGLLNSNIRQRLLENPNLTLEEASIKARAVESAMEQSLQYLEPISINAVQDHCSSSQRSVPLACTSRDSNSASSEVSSEVVAATNKKCYFCGLNYHKRSDCPARESICRTCSKTGHYAKVCRSAKLYSSNKSYHCHTIVLSSASSTPACLSKAIIPIHLNGTKANALIDTGSSTSFISERLVRKLKLPVCPSKLTVTMASTSLSSSVNGVCSVNLKIEDHAYNNVQLNILTDLCSDVILGHDILGRHASVEIQFGGSKEPLNICGLAVAKVEPVQLFRNIPSDCKPIAVKSRRHTALDTKFIEQEIQRLLKEDVIEESFSPWRAQVLVTQTENHKRRMVVDYSRTVNQYTHLDAYPLPRIEDIVNKVAKYEVFSSVDLKNAYHQIPICEEDRPYTAFEACGKLWQYKRIPFGPTNGVPCFQRTIDSIIQKEGLTGVAAYLDDVIVGGKNQQEHDVNLKKFLKAVEKYDLTINDKKSVFSARAIKLLGYIISNQEIRPDPERLTSLRELPVPSDTASLRRAMGMFAHFSNFIPRFSQKIHNLSSGNFPLNGKAVEAFNILKNDVENALVSAIDEKAVFTVETDASEHAIGATLSQDGRPVAFFSHTLNKSEQRHSSVEKEAQAIIEAVKKWRHYLLGRHFRLITDQKSVAFMFDNRRQGKVKNEKILRWRLELSCFDYEIIYRPGQHNEAADALSRICSATQCYGSKLKNIHEALCHPGLTRMNHFVKSKNLPYSLEDIRKVISACKVCAELKPRFIRHEGNLIKATHPFERINMDFKGPLPSTSRNRYLLILVDEYSRYPFAFPCTDVTSSTVISKLKILFSIFGFPSYVHSDRGPAFMSQELKSYLTTVGVATSRTTPYNPRGNGQAEKYVGILWKTIELALKSRGMDIRQWEELLGDALDSIRSLLCTATNETPHERMFKHKRRSSYGQSTPSWLLTPGPVYLRKHIRRSKYEPLIQEVTLLEANPEYAHIQLTDGRETTVSTRDLAPVPSPDDISQEWEDEEREVTEDQPSYGSSEHHRPSTSMAPPGSPESSALRELNSPESQRSAEGDPGAPPPHQQPRRSTRIRRPPTYLKDYCYYLGGSE